MFILEDKKFIKALYDYVEESTKHFITLEIVYSPDAFSVEGLIDHSYYRTENNELEMQVIRKALENNDVTKTGLGKACMQIGAYKFHEKEFILKIVEDIDYEKFVESLENDSSDVLSSLTDEEKKELPIVLKWLTRGDFDVPSIVESCLAVLK